MKGIQIKNVSSTYAFQADSGKNIYLVNSSCSNNNNVSCFSLKNIQSTIINNTQIVKCQSYKMAVGLILIFDESYNYPINANVFFIFFYFTKNFIK